MLLLQIVKTDRQGQASATNLIIAKTEKIVTFMNLCAAKPHPFVWLHCNGAMWNIPCWAMVALVSLSMNLGSAGTGTAL